MMLDKFKNNNSSFLLLFVFFCLIFTGIYFCFINNYGWDWDTYAMINSYLNILNNGIYVRSRGAGYLVPEIGIGFLSYNFGSFFTNIVCFSFLFKMPFDFSFINLEIVFNQCFYNLFKNDSSLNNCNLKILFSK